MSNQESQSIKDLMEQCLAGYKTDPVHLLDLSDTSGEYNYLKTHAREYGRTVEDIVSYFKGRGLGDFGSITVLEIGTFLGVVSIALAKLGFKVTATDIEEFISCKNLQRKFRNFGVAYESCNLSSYNMPFSTESFDVVISCETLEHLNFNPLPVIKEINRILKPGGLLYLSTPNSARFDNRLSLLEGRSIGNPIKDFFAQLSLKDNMIVGLHWREYTGDEIREMLQQMDFEIVLQRYDTNSRKPPPGIKKSLRKLLHKMIRVPLVRKVIYSALFDLDEPTLDDTQIALSRKKKMCERQFEFTDATKPK